MPTLARTAFCLSRHVGRHGRPLWYDTSARYARLGSKKVWLSPVSGTSLDDSARRILAAPLRLKACTPSGVGYRAARCQGPLLPVPPAHMDGSAASLGCIVRCSGRYALARLGY